MLVSALARAARRCGLALALMGLVAMNEKGLVAVLFYLVVYYLMNVGAFIGDLIHHNAAVLLYFCKISMMRFYLIFNVF